MISTNLRISGAYYIRTYHPGTQVLKWASPKIPNLVLFGENRGLDLLLDRFVGNTANDVIITSLEIGTGDEAPTEGDTELEAVAIAGIPRATQEIDGKKALIQFFVPDQDLPQDEYREVGVRMGSNLFSRALIIPTYTKSEEEDTTFVYELTLDNS